MRTDLQPRTNGDQFYFCSVALSQEKGFDSAIDQIKVTNEAIDVYLGREQADGTVTFLQTPDAHFAYHKGDKLPFKLDIDGDKIADEKVRLDLCPYAKTQPILRFDVTKEQHLAIQKKYGVNGAADINRDGLLDDVYVYQLPTGEITAYCVGLHANSRWTDKWPTPVPVVKSHIALGATQPDTKYFIGDFSSTKDKLVFDNTPDKVAWHKKGDVNEIMVYPGTRQTNGTVTFAPEAKVKLNLNDQKDMDAFQNGFDISGDRIADKIGAMVEEKNIILFEFPLSQDALDDIHVKYKFGLDYDFNEDGIQDVFRHMPNKVQNADKPYIGIVAIYAAVPPPQQ